MGRNFRKSIAVVGRDEVGDDDPEYDPEKRERGKKTV